MVRQERLIDRRVKAAGFRELKPLDQFDWGFNPSIKKKQIYDLACCRFIGESRDVLWMGPPGVGKSFLVQALAYEAIKQGFVVLYRSIFDVVRDFLHDEAFGGEERMLSKYLKPDLHHAEIITITGRSYRLRNQGRQGEQAPENDQPSKEGKNDNPTKERKRPRQAPPEPPSAE